MVEKFWPQEEEKEESSYQHRSQLCDLFFSKKRLDEKIEKSYFFKEQQGI